MTRINDLFGQYVHACILYRTKEEQEQRKKEVSECNHEFALLKETEYYGALHSSDCSTEPAVVQCVHCGFTNKFIQLENQLIASGVLQRLLTEDGWSFCWKYFPYGNAEPFESKLFMEMKPEINLISTKEPIPSLHISLLYQVAVELCGEVSLEEIWNVMKNLHDLETVHEKLYTFSKDDLQDLIKRYQESTKLVRKN